MTHIRFRPAVGLAAAALLALAGCGPNPPTRTPAGAIRVLDPWTQEGRDATHARWEAQGPAPPLRHAWTFRVPVGMAISSPVAEAGTILASAGEPNEILAVGGQDRLQWSFGPKTSYLASPVVQRSRVIVGFLKEGSSQVTVTARDIESGKQRWAWSAAAPGATAVWVAADDAQILVAADVEGRPNLWLLSPDGRLRWARSVKGEPDELPALSSGVAVVPTTEGVSAIRASSGGTLWHRPDMSPQLAAPAISGGQVFLVVGDPLELEGPKPIHALSLRTGKRVAGLEFPEGFLSSVVTPVGVYVEEFGKEVQEGGVLEGNRVVVYDPRTLKPIREIPLGAGISLDAFVAFGQGLLALGSEHTFTGRGPSASTELFLLDSSGVRWRLDLPPPRKDLPPYPFESAHSLIATGDAVLVTNEDGLHAFVSSAPS